MVSNRPKVVKWPDFDHDGPRSRMQGFTLSLLFPWRPCVLVFQWAAGRLWSAGRGGWKDECCWDEETLVRKKEKQQRPSSNLQHHLQTSTQDSRNLTFRTVLFTLLKPQHLISLSVVLVVECKDRTPWPALSKSHSAAGRSFEVESWVDNGKRPFNLQTDSYSLTFHFQWHHHDS